jgi:hypothetical protein
VAVTALTPPRTSGSSGDLVTAVNVEPDGFGGIEPQLAINDSTAFAAVNDLAFTYGSDSRPPLPSVTVPITALNQAVGERSLSTRIWPGFEWDDMLPSLPCGARHGDQHLVVTSTCNGNRYASNTTAGMILATMPPSARTNAPVAIDG